MYIDGRLYFFLFPRQHILFERNCVWEDTSVGGEIICPKPYTIIHATGYTCVVLDPFSLQEDINYGKTFLNCVKVTLESAKRIDIYKVNSSIEYRVISQTECPWNVHFFKIAFGQMELFHYNTTSRGHRWRSNHVERTHRERENFEKLWENLG